MVQVNLMGRINSKIEIKTIETENKEIKVAKFSVRCLNTLYNQLTITCYAYSDMAEKIEKNYECADYVSIWGTLYMNKNATKCGVIPFMIQPAYMMEAKKRATLLEDTAPQQDYTLEDIKEFLKLN